MYCNKYKLSFQWIILAHGIWSIINSKQIVRIITLFLAIIIKLLPVAIAIYQQHKYMHG